MSTTYSAVSLVRYAFCGRAVRLIWANVIVFRSAVLIVWSGAPPIAEDGTNRGVTQLTSKALPPCRSHNTYTTIIFLKRNVNLLFPSKDWRPSYVKKKWWVLSLELERITGDFDFLRRMNPARCEWWRLHRSMGPFESIRISISIRTADCWFSFV